jgi:hypothetical protein
MWNVRIILEPIKIRGLHKETLIKLLKIANLNTKETLLKLLKIASDA